MSLGESPTFAAAVARAQSGEPRPPVRQDSMPSGRARTFDTALRQRLQKLADAKADASTPAGRFLLGALHAAKAMNVIDQEDRALLVRATSKQAEA